VVTDLKLQGMSGLQLLDALNLRGPHPPVILITAHDSPAARNEAASRGAAAYLAKPFLGSALLAAIDSAV
jgi:CheY-like chemotaxis protein